MTRLPIYVGVLIAFVFFGGNVVAAEAPGTVGASPAVSATVNPDRGTNPELNGGEFHVIFLVSTTGLAVGEKASVEPILLSDGNVIIPFYEYCRALLRSPVQGSPETVRTTKERWEHYRKIVEARGGEDVVRLRSFCRNEPFVLHAERYVMSNGFDLSFHIGVVQFNLDKETPDYVRKNRLGPDMLLPGAAIVLAGESVAPNLDQASQGTYHFLMSSSQTVLEALMPVRKAPSHKVVNGLFQKAHSLAQEKQGLLIEPCRRWEQCSGRWHPNSRKWPKIGYEGSPVLSSSLVGDFDRDGKADLAVVMRSSTRQGRPNSIGANYWKALGFVFGNGKSVIEEAVWGEGGKSSAIGDLAYLEPLALLQVGACSFLLSPFPAVQEGNIGFQLRSLPQETNDCQDMHLLKIIEMQ